MLFVGVFFFFLPVDSAELRAYLCIEFQGNQITFPVFTTAGHWTPSLNYMNLVYIPVSTFYYDSF